jgi:hypothetical protein
MKTPRKNQNMSKPDQSATSQDLAMKALIIYQDFASAAKANAALQRAAQNSHARVKWNIRPWQVDTLKFLPTAAKALADATDAHLIVFAGGGAQSSSHWLQDWLEQWAGRRQIQTAALAVFDTRNADKLSPAAALDLPQFAKRHGLSIIFDDRGAEEHGPLFPPGFLFDPAQSKSLILPSASDRETYDEHRGWGINE